MYYQVFIYVLLCTKEKDVLIEWYAQILNWIMHKESIFITDLILGKCIYVQICL